MRTTLLTVILGTICVQSAPDKPPAGQAVSLEVEVAGFAFDGNRYDGGIGEVIDQAVALSHQLEGDHLNVTVSRLKEQSDTVLRLHFTRDASGKTHATAEADWYRDYGPPLRGEIEGLRGLIVIANDDWGVGKSLTATFLLVGNNGSRDTTLRGSFHFVNPKTGDGKQR